METKTKEYFDSVTTSFLYSLEEVIKNPNASLAEIIKAYDMFKKVITGIY